MEYRNNMPVYNWTYRKPAFNAKKKNNQKVLFCSRMDKPTAKKSYENCFLCESRNHFFKVFYSSSCLTKKKVTCKMNRTDQRRVYSLCARLYTNEKHLDLFLLLSSWNRLTWLSKNDDLFFLTQLEHFNFCSV